MELGHLSEYRWALNADDAVAAISVLGPVVIGTAWYSGMDNTDSNGFVHVSGRLRGGHCVLLRGVIDDPVRGWVLLGTNSWGASWGVGGNFKLTSADLQKLINAQGEVCVPVVRVVVPDPVEQPDPMPGVSIAAQRIIAQFVVEGLPEATQEVSDNFYELALEITEELKTKPGVLVLCLKKLLEARKYTIARLN